MLSKKLTFLFIITLSLPIALFAEDSAAPSGIDTYAGYKEQVQNICKNPAASELFWNESKQHPLLRDTNMWYVEIGDTNMKKTYTAAAKSFGSDIVSALSTTPETTVLSELDGAKTLYTARMNAIYACAVLDAKTISAKAVIKQIGGRDSEMIRDIEKQIKRNDELKIKLNCNGSTIEPSKLKKTVLDNAMYEYCNYRQYLAYLEANGTKRISEGLQNDAKNFPGKNSVGTTEELAQRVHSMQSKISQEIANTRDVFPKALVAYTEFERNYGSHIVMQFILDDYLKIRESLKKVMNPVSQLIYKGSNAQTQPGGK